MNMLKTIVSLTKTILLLLEMVLLATVLNIHINGLPITPRSLSDLTFDVELADICSLQKVLSF